MRAALSARLCSLGRNCGKGLGACALFVALGMIAAPGAHAQNHLSNPGFDVAGPLGPFTIATTAAPGPAGWSAAAKWSVFHNAPGTTITKLLPTSLLTGGGAAMLYVKTNAQGNGIVQAFGPVNTGPANVLGFVRVFVINGKVQLGVGNGGYTTADTWSRTNNAWEALTSVNTLSPANQIVIYAASPGGAEFFVENAGVVGPQLW